MKTSPKTRVRSFFYLGLTMTLSLTLGYFYGRTSRSLAAKEDHGAAVMIDWCRTHLDPDPAKKSTRLYPVNDGQIAIQCIDMRAK